MVAQTNFRHLIISLILKIIRGAATRGGLDIQTGHGNFYCTGQNGSIPELLAKKKGYQFFQSLATFWAS